MLVVYRKEFFLSISFPEKLHVLLQIWYDSDTSIYKIVSLPYIRRFLFICVNLLTNLPRII